MAETVIFAEQELEFSYNSTYDLYHAYINPTAFVLEIGKTYRVYWGTEIFDCVAMDGSAVQEGAVFIGDASGWDLAGAGEPFIIGGTADSTTNFMSLEDTEPTTRNVAVYLLEGIILKDRNGNDAVYYDIETVSFDTTTEGKQQTYTKGVAVEGLEIVPDFSSGDVTVTAPDGTLVKSAIIRKPEVEEITVGESEGAIALDFAGGNLEVTPSADDKFISKVIIEKPEMLAPENVRKGVTIAGIEGTLSGSLDDCLKYFYFNIDESRGIVTISGVLYDRIYEDTGSYDVTIPGTINDMAVVIDCA